MPEGVSFADRFVVLLSHERSGSHYLADMLVSNCRLRSFDEVCNFRAINPDTSTASFFHYKREAQTTDPDVTLRPSIESTGRLLDGYFAHLAQLEQNENTLLLDIKYGHVHNFEIGWWPSERRPFLLVWLERNRIPIVHLTRRNSLAATVSNMIAEQTNVWHRKDGDDQETPKKRIPASKAVHEALLLDREKDNFFNWLQGNATIGIYYEQIAGDEATRHEAMTDVAQFLRLPAPREFRSGHRKVTASLKSAVENYDDLASCARLVGGGRLEIED